MGYRRPSLRTNFWRGPRLDPCGVYQDPNPLPDPNRISDWTDVSTCRFNVEYHVSDDIMLCATERRQCRS